MNHEPRCSGTKICSRCKKELSVICFSVEKPHSDGLASKCRECKRKADERQKSKFSWIGGF